MKLKEAAEVLAQSEGAIFLRYPQTLNEISAEQFYRNGHNNWHNNCGVLLKFFVKKKS